MIAQFGRYNYGFRFYDPKIGRFTGVDPISDYFAYVSTYNYAENRPPGAIDLWGLQAVDMASRDPGLNAVNATPEERRQYQRNMGIGFGAGIVATGTGYAGGLGLGHFINLGVRGTAGFVANEIKDEVLSQVTGGASDVLDITKMAVKGLKNLAGSLDDIAKNLRVGSDKLTNVNVVKDDDFMQVTGDFEGVEIGVQGTFSVNEGVMTIEGVDFSGEVGVGRMRKLIKEFGSAAGVEKVKIIPNKRTTGANPGKTPEPFIIDSNE